VIDRNWNAARIHSALTWSSCSLFHNPNYGEFRWTLAPHCVRCSAGESRLGRACKTCDQAALAEPGTKLQTVLYRFEQVLENGGAYTQG
jgi:hypothetical protein